MAIITVGPGKTHETVPAAVGAASDGDVLHVYAAGSPYDCDPGVTSWLNVGKTLDFVAIDGPIELQQRNGNSYVVVTATTGKTVRWLGTWKFSGAVSAQTYRVSVAHTLHFDDAEFVVTNQKAGFYTASSIGATGNIKTTGGGASHALTKGVEMRNGSSLSLTSLLTMNSGRGIYRHYPNSIALPKWLHVGGGQAEDVPMDDSDARPGAGSTNWIGAAIWYNVATGYISPISTYNDNVTFENVTIDLCVNGFSFSTGASQIIKNVCFSRYSGKAITRVNAGGTAPVKVSFDGTMAAAIFNFTQPAPGDYIENQDPGYVDVGAYNFRLQNVTVATSGAAPALTTLDYYGDAWTVHPPIGAANLAAPLVYSVAPPQGQRGATVPVEIAGNNFSYVSAVSFGAGVTVSGFSVLSAVLIEAELIIALDAALGTRDVTITAEAGVGILVAGFEVVPPPAVPEMPPPIPYEAENLGFDLLMSEDDLSVDGSGDLETTSSGRTCLLQDVRHLLDTLPGDLFGHPTFGAGVQDLAGDEDRPEFSALVIRSLIDALTFDSGVGPRIEPDSIQVVALSRSGREARFRVDFVPLGEDWTSSLNLIWTPGATATDMVA